MTVNPAQSLYLGATLPLSGGSAAPLRVDPDHLITHSVVVGMTGSGKTGLVTVLAEEALRAEIPVILIDIKGDLPNLLLAFPSFAASEIAPWVEAGGSPGDTDPASAAEGLAEERRKNLEGWQLSETDLRDFRAKTSIRVITPGSSAGESLHVLSSLERRSPIWDRDPDAARWTLGAAVSLVLRLLGRDPDPAKSREHVILSILAERRLASGLPADLGSLLGDLLDPPVSDIGALPINTFLPARERKALAAALNSLLASPTFSSWRQGASLDVRDWLAPADGRTPAVIVSVAHLDDEERSLVLGVLLEEILAFTRSLPGSRRLRALVVLDEVYGILPPHPANPPTKRPLVSLMKQGRAFGVGVVVATQNPMDLDYRALSNAGFWCVGRLQTDADRARVIESIASATGETGTSREELSSVVRRLGQRWFLLRDVHASPTALLLQPRYAMSFLRGPMTQNEIRRALQAAPRACPAGSPTLSAGSVPNLETPQVLAGSAGPARPESIQPAAPKSSRSRSRRTNHQPIPV
jgi:hypothetical protein